MPRTEKIQAGEIRPSIPGAAWNASQEAAQEVVRQGIRRGVQPEALPQSHVYGLNVSGETVPAFGAVIIGAMADYEGEPKPSKEFRNTAVRIRKPTEACYGRFGIAVADIAAGEAGLIAVSGVCIALVDAGGAYKDRADTAVDSWRLKAQGVGSAKIVHLEKLPFQEYGYAIIQFGERQTDGVGLSLGTGIEVCEVLRFSDMEIVSPGTAYQGVVRLKKAP